MIEFLTPNLSHSIGITLNATFARIALLEQTSTGVQVKEISQVGIGDDDVNPLYNCLERLQKQSENPWIVSALSAQKVIIRPLQLHLTRISEIDEVLPFESDPLLPYACEEGVLERIIVSQEADHTDLTLFHVHNSALEEHLDLLKQAKLDPEGISCVPHSLAVFAHRYGIEGGVVVIDLEIDHFTCALCCNGTVLAAHHTGIDPKEMGALSQKELPQNIQQKIGLALLSILKQWKSSEPPTLLITGRGARIPQLAPNLAAPSNLSVATPVIPSDQLEGASAIGAAHAAILDPTTVNFRKDNFAYSRPWLRLQKIGLSYFAACLFLAAALFLYGQSSRHSRFQTIKQEYVNLVENLGHTPDEAELLYQSGRGGIPRQIDRLNLDGVQRRLRFYTKQIDEAPPEFPLNPGVPKVSQFLGWIAEYPQDESLRITQMAYTMVKRPSNKRPQEPYQVRVSLELTGTPEAARGFRDYLLKANNYISPYEEVKWSSSGGIYKAAFVLQDRTLY